jgi:hypothetical protein
VESSRLILSRIRAAYPNSLVAVVLLTLALAPAGQAQVAVPADTQALPLDTAVRTARLPNGLTYYIRRNTRPEHRAMLRRM